MRTVAIAFSSYLTGNAELLSILRGNLYEGCINFYSFPELSVMSWVSSVYIKFRAFSFKVVAPSSLQ